MGDSTINGLSAAMSRPLLSLTDRSNGASLQSETGLDSSKPREAPDGDESIITASGKDNGGTPALPPEFMDAIKGIPPDRHIKVMLVHGSHTGGHRSAAESVKKALDAMPNVDAEVVNALDFSGGESVKDAQVAATNFVMEKMAPVRGWVFRQSFKGNPLIYWLGNTSMKLKSWMSTSFLNKIEEEKPDIILSCHSPMNSLLSYWKSKGLIDVPVHSVVTDYRVHRMWAQENIDHYYVASEATKDELVHFGIDEKKIEVSGIPIKPDFAEGRGVPKAELKKKLGLDPERPTVLMMGGSLGLGRFDEMAKALDMRKMPAQMVCITGKNETKKAALEELSGELSLPVKALGYVDNVNEWMDAADIIISKPGGLTTSEIFAKKIPMIILDPMPGLEEMLIPTIVDTGAAISVKGPEKAAQFIEDFFTDPSLQERFQSSLEKAGKPFAAYEVAADLVNSACESPEEKTTQLPRQGKS
jgi:processive 1,2-diacylglycerol beta-glucosyltransferase